MKTPNVKDVIVFSRIIGTALLICGYLVAGLLLARWCSGRGYPAWTTPLCLVGALAAALASGIRELKNILALIRKDAPRSRSD